MAARTTLNGKNLAALGPERLAALVMELVTGDAALKRQARAALLEEAGGDALAAEVRKRIATIKRSTSFVDWRAPSRPTSTASAPSSWRKSDPPTRRARSP